MIYTPETYQLFLIKIRNLFKNIFDENKNYEVIKAITIMSFH